MLHLETTQIDYLAVSLSWPSGHSSNEPSAVSFVACSKGITQTGLFSGGWSPLLSSRGCWQNSVPFTRRTEIPIFLLADH